MLACVREGAEGAGTPHRAHVIWQVFEMVIERQERFDLIVMDQHFRDDRVKGRVAYLNVGVAIRIAHRWAASAET